MKQVVQTLPPPPVMPQIAVNQANDHKFYGMQTYAGKAFLTQRTYKSGEYVWISLDGLTYCNSYTPSNVDSSFDNLSEALKYGIDFHKNRVYEFDTAKELMTWLAAD